MAFAYGANRRVALIAEATAGTTPTTPTFLITRTVTAEANVARPKVDVNERRSDRMLAQVYKGLAGSSANLSIEWTDDDVLDSLLESALQGTWSTNVLKNAATQKSFTMEITDETGATDSFYRVRGLQVNTMSINIAPGQAITSQIGMIGMDGVQDTAIITGATYTAAGTELVFCGTDFTLTDLYSLSSPQIAGITLNITNNLRPQHSLNSSISPYPFGIGNGSFRVSGEITCFRQDNTVAALDLADTQGDIQFTIGVATNKKYSFDMLTAAVTGHRVTDGGNNGDVMDVITFSALYDSGDTSALKITRNVA